MESCSAIASRPGVAVEAGSRAALAAHGAALHEPGQEGRRRQTVVERRGQRAGDVGRYVEPDLVHQPERAHRHPPCHQIAVQRLPVAAIFEHARRLHEIGKEDAVDQESGPVAHHHRRLAQAPRQLHRAGQRVATGRGRGGDLHQRHAVDRVEEVHARNRSGRRSDAANRSSGSDEVLVAITVSGPTAPPPRPAPAP